MNQSLILTRYEKSEDIWTSLIAVHRLDLQVVLCLCVRGRPAMRERLNYARVASGCSLFRGKNVWCSTVGTKKSVHCPEFRGGRFSEVANVLHKQDFQSVTGTLSALGSVSALRSVRSGRFYCIMLLPPSPQNPPNIHTHTLQQCTCARKRKKM